ncbi:hypothetical protein HYV12_00930 [Candidatus Dojkabacteria bacterium]|nr:hypothetical protein [Candidatus Dojkabacteria bacterium]
MKTIRVVLTIFLLTLSFFTPVFAEGLESDNYKIIDLSTNSGGEVTKSNTDNYNLLSTVGTFSGDPRSFSTNYRSGIGTVEIFTAKVPTISCFETDTDGSSQCTTGPSYLNTDGMITVCGPNGCYDRARFEINTQGNPADTLYAIQISTDNFTSDTRYIDGVSSKPKATSQRTLVDYKTKGDWETPALNIKGLVTDTQYYIRAIALHGDFTESDPGPTVTATTATTYVNFDIDIDNLNGITTETNGPYLANFGSTRNLIQTGPPQTSVDLIWMDMSTNALGGFSLVQKGQYGGLFSTTESYTIPSDNFDLNGESEGFGIQNFYSAQEKHTGSGLGDLGTLSVEANYAGSGNTVGKVDQIFIKMYEASKPILNGRVGIYLKARASGTTPVASDYSEDISLIIVPRY